MGEFLDTQVQEVETIEVHENCAEHGSFLSKVTTVLGKEFKSKCPQCEEQKQFEKEESEAEFEFSGKRDRVQKAFPEYDLPPRFRDKTFENYTQDEQSGKVYKTCLRYAEAFDGRLEAGGGLVMCGNAGTGKTHLASAIINHVTKRRHICVFMSVLAAVRHVKQTYSRESQKTEHQAIKDFINPDLLILDEVGVQFGTDAEKIILFEIINQRYQHMRPTILISNLTLGELSEYIGDRVIDRMYEGGGAVLSFDWESYRRSAK